MSVSCECCVLSSKGLCEGSITCPEESYRMWCVCECNFEASVMRRPWPTRGCCDMGRGGCRNCCKLTYLRFPHAVLLSLNQWQFLLGASAKLRKAIISFVMCVCPFDRMEHLGSHWTDFREIIYLNIFPKFVSLKSDKSKGYFTWSPMYICDHISLNFSQNEKYSDKSYKKIKTHILWSITFSPKMLQHPANRTHNPQLHTRPATWKPQHEIPQAATTV